MKIFAKFVDKMRKVGKKGKFLVCSAMATIGAAAMTVCASAAEAETSGTGVDMKATMASAGQSLMAGFNDLIDTMIPVIIGIFTAGLVIFGLFALIKLAKRIFGKVAG